MKIIYITGGLTPYRIAFCDEVNKYLYESGKGILKLFLLSDEGFNTNYNNDMLMRPYAEFIPGKTLVLKDNTTRFMINPGISKKVRKEKPDFIVLGGSWAHPSTWILLSQKRRLKVPIYFWAESHFHNGLKRKQNTWWKKIIKKKVYNRFDGFFVPGQYAKEAIIKTHSKRANNCVQLPNLVDGKKYSIAVERRKNKYLLRERYDVKQEKIILFTSSRLVDLKGLLEFLHNGREELSDSNFEWIIAGMGPLEEEIKKYALQNGIDIRLIGFVKQDVIIDYLALADWFLLPSLSDPNPLSVIEALWAGLPLALSQYVGNTPETLQDGKNGFIFDTLLKKSVCDLLTKIRTCELSEAKASVISQSIAQNYFDITEQSIAFIRNIEGIIKNEK